MSNQPPPAFGGYPHFPQQWPPPYPSMLPPDFHTNPEYLAAAQVPTTNSNQPYDPNLAAFYANAQLTGPASHAHPFYPPPLPFMHPFDPSQVPLQPFPPMPMQPVHYSPVQTPAGSSNPQPVSMKAPAVNENARRQPRQQPKKKAKVIDSNREEGEISEEDNARAGPTESGNPSNSARWKRLPSNHSDLEEGETISSKSRSSSRSSTPYNPPLSVAADSDVMNHAIEMQKQEKPTAAPKEVSASRSSIQLRVQAQGALLSLVPHNIQFHELVAEGLNPAILKELYKEVGIKVNIEAENRETPVQNTTSSVPVLIKPAELAKQAKVSKPAEISKPVDVTAPKKASDGRRKSLTAPPAPSSAIPSAPQSDAGKPMERKEVIARMLAAKAAKASEAATKPVPSEPQTVTTTPTPTPSATPSEPQPKSVVVPMREKNKAQTELARQRIEELRRQAFLRSQQKAQLKQNTNTAQIDQTTNDTGSATPVAQHPLPVRPLSLKHSAGPPIESANGVVVDATPVSRAGQRKRPRASDFDESDAAHKKQLAHGTGHLGKAHRLIIEFSDEEDDDEDESLYGNDPDSMDVDSNHEPEVQPAVTLDISRPPLQKFPSSTSTPLGLSWQSDNENMRQKDLEIQEMHRKIALLEEQRKARKAKLAANQTESPRVIDDSTASSSADNLSSADGYGAETSLSASAAVAVPETTTTTSAADHANPIDSSGAQTQMSTNSRVNDGGENDLVNTQVPIPSSTSTQLVTHEPEGNSAIGQANEFADSPSSPSQSDSSGSAMDESEDISSPREDFASYEEPATLGEPSTSGYAVSLSTEQCSNEAESPVEPISPSSGDDSNSASRLSLERSPPLDVEDDSMVNPSMHDTQAKQFIRESSAASEESEAYEPPEPDTTEEPNSPYSPPFSPAPAPLDDLDNTMAVLDDLPADKPLTGGSQVPVSEPHPDSQVGITGNQTSSASAAPKSKFTPYVSPLRSFKAYRYHPGYTQDVSDGYRSLTYSHDIDSMSYFCPYELAGGICNDRSCQFQHFRDMTLSVTLTSADDKILIEMGSVREGKTEEEKETYLAGLKEIINELRRDKVKDFSTVAAEIAAYRRRFLKDPTRVLSL
ncbi:hypothetical protein N7454_002117 [Penicillium verhagenii]|nr:hypothetical protein N7454_002117 [Penicillium verhagenii]